MPKSAVTEMDPQSFPSALVADILSSMGIGKLRAMTRVSRLGIAVTGLPPPKAVHAWDPVAIIGSTPVH